MSAVERSNPQEQDPLLKGRYVQVERVQLVLLPTTVTDSKGRPVAGLRSGDFRLTEDGRPRPIEYFATEADAPVSLAFLLDLSGSMRQETRLPEAKQAISAFVDSLGRKDRFGLIGFADKQVSWITDFTSNVRMFKARLGLQEAYGQTALYDALAACPGLVEETTPARKAIVLFTDGLDNASSLPALQAMQIARRVPVPIYAVSFIHIPREMMSPESREALLLLERFSRETGGLLFTVQNDEELHEAASRIQQDLRLQYVLGFQPDRRDGDRRFHRIQIETSRKSLHVRSRTGYYTGP